MLYYKSTEPVKSRASTVLHSAFKSVAQPTDYYCMYIFQIDPVTFRSVSIETG